MFTTQPIFREISYLDFTKFIDTLRFWFDRANVKILNL